MAVPIENAVALLRSAILNSRLYPATSPVVHEAVQAVYQAFQACLADSPSISINDIDGKLFFNQNVPLPKNEIRPFLLPHEIQSLTFERGFTLDEVTTLVQGLAKRKEELGGGILLPAWLKTQGVTHLRAEEFQFVAVRKGEDIARQIHMLFGQEYDKFSSVVDAIEKSMQMLNGVTDDTDRRMIQDAMIQQLTGLKPEMLRDFFDKQLPPSFEQLGLRQRAFETLSREKIEEVLAEVDTWYDGIAEDPSESSRSQKVLNLRKFITHLVQTPAGKSIPQVAYSQLRVFTSTDPAAAAARGSERAAFLAQVEEILHQPPTTLLESSMRDKGPALLKSLCGMREDALADRLTRKVGDNLIHDDSSVRDAAVRMLRLFQDILTSSHQWPPLGWLISTVSQMAESEKNAKVYAGIAGLLGTAAMDLLLSNQTGPCTQLLIQLRRHASDEAGGLPKKQAAAREIQEFAQRATEVLCTELLASPPERPLAAEQILATLGDSAVLPLLALAQRASDARTRQLAIQGLRRYPETSRDAILQLLNIRLPAEPLLKLLPLLISFADASTVNALTPLLAHPDAAVRRETASALAMTKESQVLPILVTLIDDADPAVQAEAVRLLRSLRATAMGPELIKRLLGSPPAVQEELCIALGDFKVRRAVPSLIQLLDLPGALWHRSKKIPEPVRVRAAWALGQFLPDRSIEHALRKALKDPSRTVQATAQAALGRLIPPGKKT